jgi:hypothetical protein
MLRANILHRTAQVVSSVYTNSFTYINIHNTPQSWPIRDIFKVKEYLPDIQPTVYQPAAPSKFRDSIMDHAQQLERSKQAPKRAVAGDGMSKKRKSPEVTIGVSLESGEPLIKRLKTTKQSIVESHKIKIDTSEKTTEISTSFTGLSKKTMDKLDAFRFSAQSKPVEDDQMLSLKAKKQSTRKIKTGQNAQAENARPKYVMKDHSSRLIQLGKEEMAKEEAAKASEATVAVTPVDASTEYRRGDAARESNPAAESDITNQRVVEENAVHTTPPPARYKIKDHGSRLIAAGIEELAAQPNDAAAVISKDHEGSEARYVHFTEDDDVFAGINDLEDSFFDGSSLDDSVFGRATSTDTSGLTEMDDMEDSFFDQIIADDEADWEEAPTSAQAKIDCFSRDTVSSPTKLGLTLPPKLPSSVTPPMAVERAETQAKNVLSDSPLSPFLRPVSSTLVTVPSAISNLNPEGRITTCFRIAELLRELSRASPPAAIELFATVTASARNRDNTRQSFTFADVFFPQRPPYVQGIYGKCSESELFDDDSRLFLMAGPGGRAMLARAIVTAKPRTGKQPVWNQKNGFHAAEEAATSTEVEILSIYVCPREDIEYTKGIVMPEKEVQIKKEGEKEVFFKPEKRRKFQALKPLDHQSKALKDISSNLPSSPITMTGNNK